jgi:ribosomal protein S18 acetylase RimI-like enzyme
VNASQPQDAAKPKFHVDTLNAGHRPSVCAILRDTAVFQPFEIETALEVFDAFNANPDQDYFALGAFTQDGSLVGYVCYGPTPCTAGTFDLYWIAVSPNVQNSGAGTLLLQEVERRLARSGARLVIIETSSLPRYHATREFYARRGYGVAARVPDFYADGDDRLIYVKRLSTSDTRRKPKWKPGRISSGKA